MANQTSKLVDGLEIFFEETIRKMERQFTSHEFFLKLLHTHQNEYVAALAAYADKGSPFKDLHNELVKRLRKLDDISLQKSDYSSQNIFGIPSTTALWRKK